MTNLLQSFFTCSIFMIIPCIFLILLGNFISKYYNLKTIYYGWIFIIIGFIIPFRPFILTDLLSLTMPVNNNIYAYNNYNYSNFSGLSIFEGSDKSPINTSFNINLLLCRLWLAGFIICLFIFIIRNNRFVKRLNRWSCIENNSTYLIIFNKSKYDIGYSGNVILKSCSFITSPMTIGLLKPQIFLPDRLCYSENELNLIFRHELIHIKRKDLLLKYLLSLAVCLHWFNPFIYIMHNKFINICEQSCDEEVIKNIDLKERLVYSEIIIRTSGICPHFNQFNLSGGKNMKKRIASIMNLTSTKKKTAVFFLCCLLGITAFCGYRISYAENNNSSEEVFSKKVLVDTTTLFVRDAPSVDGNVITLVDKDTTLYALDPAKLNDDEYEWVKVKVSDSGQIGYVYSEYIENEDVH